MAWGLARCSGRSLGCGDPIGTVADPEELRRRVARQRRDVAELWDSSQQVRVRAEQTRLAAEEILADNKAARARRAADRVRRNDTLVRYALAGAPAPLAVTDYTYDTLLGPGARRPSRRRRTPRRP